MECQYQSAALLNTSSLTKHPASFCQGLFKMQVMHSRFPESKASLPQEIPAVQVQCFISISLLQ